MHLKTVRTAGSTTIYLVAKLVSIVLKNPEHFEKMNVMVVGSRSKAEETVTRFGLNDKATVSDELSDSALVADEQIEDLDKLFNLEQYSETVDKLPIDLQMTFYEQMWSLLDATSRILDFMEAKSDALAHNQVAEVKGLNHIVRKEVDDVDEDEEPNEDEPAAKDANTDKDEEKSGSEKAGADDAKGAKKDAKKDAGKEAAK